MSDDVAADQAPEPKPPLFDRARVARLVAILGALVFVLSARWLVLPKVPQERDVEMRLASPADVVALDVRWSTPGSTDDIATTSLRFPAGAAPTSVHAKVTLPDGAYDVAIHVERTSGVDSTRRRVTFEDADRVTIPLR